MFYALSKSKFAISVALATAIFHEGAFSARTHSSAPQPPPSVSGQWSFGNMNSRNQSKTLGHASGNIGSRNSSPNNVFAPGTKVPPLRTMARGNLVIFKGPNDVYGATYLSHGRILVPQSERRGDLANPRSCCRGRSVPTRVATPGANAASRTEIVSQTKMSVLQSVREASGKLKNQVGTQKGKVPTVSDQSIEQSVNRVTEQWEKKYKDKLDSMTSEQFDRAYGELTKNIVNSLPADMRNTSMAYAANREIMNAAAVGDVPSMIRAANVGIAAAKAALRDSPNLNEKEKDELRDLINRMSDLNNPMSSTEMETAVRAADQAPGSYTYRLPGGTKDEEAMYLVVGKTETHLVVKKPDGTFISGPVEEVGRIINDMAQKNEKILKGENLPKIVNGQPPTTSGQLSKDGSTRTYTEANSKIEAEISINDVTGRITVNEGNGQSYESSLDSGNGTDGE